MIGMVVLMSTALGQGSARLYRHMDACLDGDGEACVWVAERLTGKKFAGELHRARDFASQGCVLGHEPSCAWLFDSLETPKPGDYPAPPVMDACRRQSQPACQWLVRHYDHSALVDGFEPEPMEMSLRLYDTLTVDVADILPEPSGAVTAVRRMPTLANRGLFSGGTVLAEHAPMLSYYPSDGQPPVTVFMPDRITRGARHEWLRLGRDGWWNPTTGEVRELPEWCEWSPTCVPEEPPWWVAELDALRVEFPEHLVRPMRDHLWLVSRGLNSRREPPPSTVIIARDGQRTEVALHGNLRIAGDDLALVFRDDRARAYSGAGDVLWEREMQAFRTALSPSGSVLASEADLYDARTGEQLYASAHGCRGQAWSASGELWCSAQSGVTIFTVEGAGVPESVPFVPPGGWDAYGQMTARLAPQSVLSLQRNYDYDIQTPELPTDADGRLRLLFSESDERYLQVSIATGRDEEALVTNIGLPWLPPGAADEVEFPMHTVRIEFPDCIEDMIVVTSFAGLSDERGTLVSRDCAVSIGPMLEGTRVSARARDRDGRWQVSGHIAPDAVLTATYKSAPLQAPQDHQPYEEDAVTAHVLLPRDLSRTTAVLFRSDDQLLVETSHYETLRGAYGHADFVPLSGRMSVRLLPGDWTVWAVTPDGRSASVALSAGGDVASLPLPERPPGAMVRVVDEEGLPVAWYGARMRWSDTEPRGSAEYILEADLAGRIFVPDVGEPLTLEGIGWTTTVEPGDSVVQVRRK